MINTNVWYTKSLNWKNVHDDKLKYVNFMSMKPFFIYIILVLVKIKPGPVGLLTNKRMGPRHTFCNLMAVTTN